MPHRYQIRDDRCGVAIYEGANAQAVLAFIAVKAAAEASIFGQLEEGDTDASITYRARRYTAVLVAKDVTAA